MMPTWVRHAAMHMRHAMMSNVKACAQYMVVNQAYKHRKEIAL